MNSMAVPSQPETAAFASSLVLVLVELESGLRLDSGSTLGRGDVEFSDISAPLQRLGLVGARCEHTDTTTIQVLPC
jgi:hypothetical protein